MTTAELTILPEKKKIKVPLGINLKEALGYGQIHLRGSCGGKGTCRQCIVYIDGSQVLSCRMTVFGDLIVDVPEGSRVPEGRVDEAGSRVHIRPDTAARLCLAMDIGTTTIASALVSEHGEVVRHTSFNPQARYGEDVISRIIYAEENQGGLAVLRDLVVGELNTHIRELAGRAGIDPDHDIITAAVSGNTTMLWLLLGSDPAPIRREAVDEVGLGPRVLTAGSIGLALAPETVVRVVPQVSAFVGGDVVMGVLSTGLANSSDVRLLIDLGTNGEMVLGNDQWLAACACSAGPAFEGGGITSGVPAIPGAVEAVTVDPLTGTFECSTIGGREPVGICGSGLISALSSLFEAGLIDRAGNFVRTHPMFSGARIASSMPDFEGIEICRAKGGRSIMLSRSDIDNLIRAKAAIYAGIRTLAGKVGIGLEDITEVLVAGGFGSSLDIDRAVSIGLLPDIPRHKFRVVGNSSLAGAAKCAISENEWNRAQEIARMITYIDLAKEPGFLHEYTGAMFLPHTDLAQFPSSTSLRRKGSKQKVVEPGWNNSALTHSREEFKR